MTLWNLYEKFVASDSAKRIAELAKEDKLPRRWKRMPPGQCGSLDCGVGAFWCRVGPGGSEQIDVVVKNGDFIRIPPRIIRTSMPKEPPDSENDKVTMWQARYRLPDGTWQNWAAWDSYEEAEECMKFHGQGREYEIRPYPFPVRTGRCEGTPGDDYASRKTT
jgi:hypothetical protein